MLRSRHLSLLALSLVWLSSCRGCRQDAGPSTIVELAPPDALFVAHVPDTGRLIQGLAGFVSRATRNAGAGAVRRLRDGTIQQLGFDALDPQAYAALGIAGQGGALVFAAGAAPEPLVALAIAEPVVFEAKLKELIQKTDGANRVSETSVAGWRLVSVGRPFGDEVVPAFHWGWVGRYVIIARDAGRSGLEQTLTRLAALKQQPTAASVRTDPLYLKLSRKLADPILSVFVRGEVARELGVDSPVHGAITGISVDGQGVVSDTFVELALPGLDTALAGAPAAGLTERVAADAAVLLLSQSARKEAIAALRSHPTLASLLTRGLTPLAEATAVDPEGELLPLLTGPLTASVHVGDLAELPARLKSRRDVRALLDFVDVVVTADVSEPQAFVALLARSQAKLKERGIRIRQRTTSVSGTSATIFEPDRPEPKLGWAVIGKTYVYAVGAGRLDATLKLLRTKSDALAAALDSSVAKELLGEPGTSVFVVRLGTLVSAAAAVPLGGGKAKGMGAEVLIGAALDFLRTVGDVAVAVSAEPGFLRLRLRERLQ